MNEIIVIKKSTEAYPTRLPVESVLPDGKIRFTGGHFLITSKNGGLGIEELRRCQEAKNYDSLPECNFVRFGVNSFPDGEIVEVMYEEEWDKRVRRERNDPFELIETHTAIKPKGGEFGRDGYWDRTYRHIETGEEIRMITRDVFDVGRYHCPKRFNRMLTPKSEWTENEIALADFLGGGLVRM